MLPEPKRDDDQKPAANDRDNAREFSPEQPHDVPDEDVINKTLPTRKPVGPTDI